MARRPVLCTLAFTLSGAVAPGDQVGLVQQSLQKFSLAEEEPELSQGVLGVLGSVVNMMKFDNLLRDRILNFDPEAPVPPESPVPEPQPEKSHEMKLEQAPAEVPAVAPAVAPKQSEQSLMAGTGCSVADQSRMNTSIANLGRLALQKGPMVLQQALPQQCSRIFGVGVNFTAFDGCVQQFFEVGPTCSACQVNLLKGLVGTDIFHLGCMPKCTNILAKCTPLKEPSKACLAAVGNCMDCGMPSWKEQTQCVGGLPNRQQGMQVLDGLVMALKSGDIAEPGTFKTILQRAASSGLS